MPGFKGERPAAFNEKARKLSHEWKNTLVIQKIQTSEECLSGQSCFKGVISIESEYAINTRLRTPDFTYSVGNNAGTLSTVNKS